MKLTGSSGQRRAKGKRDAQFVVHRGSTSCTVPRPAVRRALTCAAGAVLLGGSAAQAAIVLYEYESFGGAQITLEAPTHDLDRTPFNDRARSMVVRRDAWELCSDARFRGNCRVFPPGRYPQIPDLSGQVSSARPYPGGGGPGVGPGRPGAGGGGWEGGPEGGRGGGRSALTLFAGDDFNGERLVLDRPANNLDRGPFNDRAWSVVIRRGTWELCTDAQFQGDCRVLRPGAYRLSDQGIGGRVSSLRPLSPY